MTRTDSGAPAAPADFYDSYWSQIGGALDPSERDRLSAVLSLVPTEVRSILDAGCGDGRLLRLLGSRDGRISTGVDFSLYALKAARPLVAQSVLQRLPFRAGSFDLTVTCDVLEHIEEEVYQAVLDELLRVSRRWILVNTPYREPRYCAAVRCRGCGRGYHSYHHLRAYDEASYRGLFAGRAELREIRLCGADVLYRPSLPVSFAERMQWGANGRSSCPRCGSPEPPVPRITRAAKTIVMPFVYQFNKLHLGWFTQKTEIAALFEKKGS